VPEKRERDTQKKANAHPETKVSIANAGVVNWGVKRVLWLQDNPARICPHGPIGPAMACYFLPRSQCLSQL